jgi:hypothetical protein
LDETLYAVPQRGIEDVAGTLDVGGVDVLRRVERQGRRGMNDEVSALYCPVQQRFVPDVGLDDLDPVALRIIELLHVDRGNGVAPGEEVPREVDPQKPGPAGDENSLLVHPNLLVHKKPKGALMPAQAAHFSMSARSRFATAWQHFSFLFVERLMARCA